MVEKNDEQVEVGGRHKIDDVALIERRDREIERLLDALMQEKRETARLREALQMLSNYGSPAPRQWWAEDIRRIALAALGEDK